MGLVVGGGDVFSEAAVGAAGEAALGAGAASAFLATVVVVLPALAGFRVAAQAQRGREGERQDRDSRARGRHFAGSGFWRLEDVHTTA
jgi:hypothetical protein